MDRFLDILNEHNLCTWYILPWLGMNFNSFGGLDNFVNSYLVRGRMKIAVKVLDEKLCSLLREHPNYRGSLYRGEENTSILVFNIPDRWKDDYELFLQGKYSRMSEAAKTLIRRGSGLKYEVKNEKGIPISDSVLLALDKHPVLRKKWLEILGSDTQLPEELIDAPKDRWFIDLDGEL